VQQNSLKQEFRQKLSANLINFANKRAAETAAVSTHELQSKLATNLIKKAAKLSAVPVPTAADPTLEMRSKLAANLIRMANDRAAAQTASSIQDTRHALSMSLRHRL
jgi:hypothetical protein